MTESNKAPSSSSGDASGADLSGTDLPLRTLLRQRLLAQRRERGEDRATESALAAHLREVLLALEPEVLGVYWPVRLEFNPLRLLGDEPALMAMRLALPWVSKQPTPRMVYRAWDRQPPRLKDEVGIAASDGAPVVPDVVLAPCVGYTDTGLRLGYGGGYFDRFLAAHPHVTAIGIAPSWSRVDFEGEAHDIPLPLIVTEAGTLTP